MFTARILAFGTTAPDSSRIDPSIRDVVVWENSGVVKSATKVKKQASRAARELLKPAFMYYLLRVLGNTFRIREIRENGDQNIALTLPKLILFIFLYLQVFHSITFTINIVLHI